MYLTYSGYIHFTPRWGFLKAYSLIVSSLMGKYLYSICSRKSRLVDNNVLRQFYRSVLFMCTSFIFLNIFLSSKYVEFVNSTYAYPMFVCSHYCINSFIFIVFVVTLIRCWSEKLSYFLFWNLPKIDITVHITLHNCIITLRYWMSLQSFKQVIL